MKKILIFILTMCISLASALPALAAEVDTKSLEDMEEVILRVLSSVEFEKEEYGLDH